MFLLNSRRGHFTAAGLEVRHPFSRSYGAIVPSSLMRFLSRALASSCHPTCVGLRYGRQVIAMDFSCQPSPTCLRRVSPPSFVPRLPARQRTSDSPRTAASCHPLPKPCRRRNVDLPPVGYASRPGLRIRLTPGGRTCPGKPWVFGGRDFHPPFRYSCPHNRSHTVHARSR